MSAFTVTGTDTDVGKTVFAAALTGALDAHYWKPVQAGLDEGGDRAQVAKLAGLPETRVLPEAYRLATPCSPHRAAEIDGVAIDPDRLALPAQRPLVVEGAGGALTPGQFVRLRLDLPVENGVIALPQTAVISSLYGDFVYVVRPREGEDEMLEVRQVFVTPGRRSDGMIEIREGIAAGDRIVTTGQNRLSNGAPVTLAEEGAAPADGPDAAAEEVSE